jgi:dienelactone hydrolase
VFGFRCAIYPSKESLQVHFDPYTVVGRDYSKEQPVNDEIFAVLKTFYNYDKKPLNSKTESVKSEDYLTIEKVSFDAPYGTERMQVYLFIPAKIRPPYQTIFYYPSSSAVNYDSSKMIEQSEYGNYLDFLVRSGRLVVYPILKGTYERGGGSAEWFAQTMSSVQTDKVREWRIQCIKDMRRTIDYLETRNDVDHNNIAYYGYSMGARAGSIAGALEDRFKLLILEHGGLPSYKKSPEIDEINFAPRVHVPVLMINGSFDHVFSVETQQKPLFRLLGTPENDKQHFIFSGGHTSPRNEVVRLILDGLDRYLGKV